MGLSLSTPSLVSLFIVSHLFDICFSISEAGPWVQILDRTLEDSRTQNDPLPLQTFNFNSVSAKYVKFKLISYWGKGGGLQYFNLKKSKPGDWCSDVWFSHHFHMIFIWFSYDLHMIFIWFSYDFHMIFIWFFLNINT